MVSYLYTVASQHELNQVLADSYYTDCTQKGQVMSFQTDVR